MASAVAFELMEDLLDVPTVFVEQDDLIGRQGEIAGQVGVGHAILGIGVNNALHHHAGGGARQMVRNNPFVFRVAMSIRFWEQLSAALLDFSSVMK